MKKTLCEFRSKNQIITFKINITFGTVTGPVLQLVPELVPELVRETIKIPFYVRLGLKIK